MRRLIRIKPLFSVGLPVLLCLGFLIRQFFDFNDIGLSNGFEHPLTGWDHLLTMLAVGIWAAQLRGKAIWMLPLAFVGVMSLGGLAGAAGFEIPNVDGIILLSCAVFTVLITRRIRFSNKINILIVAFFAFFHGFAHGQEISTSASLVSYTVGFMLATLLLHGAGILAAKLVMLAVTCLLGFMFSGIAASASTTTLSSKQLQSQRPLNQDRFGAMQSLDGIPIHVSPHPEMTNSTHPPLDQDSLLDLSLNGLTSALLVGLDSEHVHGKPCVLKTSVISKVDCNYGAETGLALRSIVDDDSIAGTAPIPPEYRLKSMPCFKQRFPDINQTPGRILLSNGVGATSPPAILLPLAFLISSLLQTSNSQPFAVFLRSRPTKFKLHLPVVLRPATFSLAAFDLSVLPSCFAAWRNQDHIVRPRTPLAKLARGPTLSL